MEAEIVAGTFVWRSDREDVHMNIESALIDKVGEPGKMLHTARSRNDQVGDAESSLSDAKSSLGDAESSLGDAKSSLGDAAGPRHAHGENQGFCD